MKKTYSKPEIEQVTITELDNLLVNTSTLLIIDDAPAVDAEEALVIEEKFPGSESLWDEEW